MCLRPSSHTLSMFSKHRHNYNTSTNLPTNLPTPPSAIDHPPTIFLVHPLTPPPVLPPSTPRWNSLPVNQPRSALALALVCLQLYDILMRHMVGYDIITIIIMVHPYYHHLALALALACLQLYDILMRHRVGYDIITTIIMVHPYYHHLPLALALALVLAFLPLYDILMRHRVGLPYITSVYPLSHHTSPPLYHIPSPLTQHLPSTLSHHTYPSHTPHLPPSLLPPPSHFPPSYLGIPGLYRGLSMRLMTVIPSSAIMVTVYEFIKNIEM